MIKKKITFTVICVLIFQICFTQNFEAKLDTYLQPYLDMDAWSGVILVSQSGKPIFAKGYGEANREWNINNTIDTKFRIASISKLFTEVSILQIVDKNQLALDDKLSQFIPDYPRGNEITIKNLLNHTSGIPHLNSFSNYDDLIKFDYTINEVINLFKGKELDFNPGKKYNYSNSGYVLLAFIIEKISGKSYEEFLRDNVWLPQKLENTGIDDSKKILNKRANGYQYNFDGNLVNADYVNNDIKVGGGSLYSTATDLAHFIRSVANRKIVKDNLDQLTNFVEKNGKNVFVTNGRVQGFCHQITHWINEDLTIVVLGNNYSNIALPISDDIYKIYNNKSYTIPKNYLVLKKIIPVEQLKQYEGTYDFGFGPVGQVSVVNQNLTYKGPGKPSYDVLIPLGNDTFFYKQNWVLLRFIDKTKNEYKTLQWVMGDNAYPAQKIELKNN